MATSEAIGGAVLSTPGYGVSTGVDTLRRFLRSEHGPFHCLMAGIAVSLSVALAGLFRAEHISVKALYIPQFLLSCGLPICAAAIYCYWADLKQLRDGCWMVAWGCVFVNLLRLPSYPAARTGAALRDHLLGHLDQLIGVNVGSVVLWVRGHPDLDACSSLIYASLPLMVGAAVLIPSVTGRIRRTKEFILTIILAALLGSCILAAFPAIGPWSAQQFAPSSSQSWATRQSLILRSPGLFSADPGDDCGLIAFPSFHVAFAIWSAFALWPFRWLRWPAALLALLVSISTVTTGWHYATDGIGGALLAWLGIWLSRRIIGLSLPLTSQS